MKNLKRKFWYLILVCCLPLLNASAQNLVPNPSFEDTTFCPAIMGQISKATGWLSFTDSPDYYNACANSVSTPQNGSGYQVPFDGVAYAGLLVTGANIILDLREYLGIQLTQPLFTGQTYYVSFRAALSNILGRDCWADKLGAKFTTYNFSALEGNTALITNFSQIYTDSLVNDTINWITVKGSFISDSSYQYVVIGNFFDDANTDTLNCPYIGYVFIDMVCVSLDSTTCYQYLNTNSPGSTEQEPFSIYPNPATDNITITTRTEGDLKIYDTAGRLVLKKENVSDKKIVNISSLPPGMYNASLFRKGKVVHCRFLIW